MNARICRESRLAMVMLTSVIALSTSTVAAAQVAASATGQDETSAKTDQADAAVPGDIIVTAQKRSERLQDVPLAVTAVGGGELQTRQINDTNSLVRAVPSLSYQQGNNPTNTGFRVRGIGTQLFGQGFEPSVSVVIDGVVMARGQQGFADLNDIERIEVLRGPQGTLFGKNSTAGAINVVTERPSREFQVSANATVAEEDEYRVNASVSGPITDSLRARVSGYYNDIGGIFTNVTTKSDWGGNTGYGVRGKLEWDATSNLNFLATADYRKSDADCCRPILIRAVNPRLAALYLPVVGSPDNRQTAENAPTFTTSNSQVYSLQGDLDLGGATITSITAFQRFFLRNNVDNDGIDTTVPRYTGGTSGAAYSQWDLGGGSVRLKNFTQELRIASNGGGPFTYVAGAYYSTLNIFRDFARRRAYCAAGTAAQLGQPCTPLRYESHDYDSTFKNDSIALFGQIEWELLPKLKVIAGARGEHLSVSARGFRSGIPLFPGDVIFPGAPAVNATRSAKDDAVSGRAGLQYEFSRNAQVYATYSHGYKAPGFGTEIATDFANQPLVNAETVDGYEIGFKGSTADRKFSIALAGFYQKYRDLQIQTSVNDPIVGPIARTTNAGSSLTKGFEAEATFRPDRNFSLNVGVAYTKATINIDGFDCPITLQSAAPVVDLSASAGVINQCFVPRFTNAAGQVVTGAPLVNLRGIQLPATPEWKINVSPQYEHDIGANLVGLVRVDLNFQSDVSRGLFDPLLRQASYALVDLNIGLRTSDNRYSVRAFVRNLFDTTYYTDLSHGLLLNSAATPNDLFAQIPKDADRYAGVSFGVRF